MESKALETIKALRTVHWNFNDKPVSDEDVRKIVEYGMCCANSDNLCDYSVIVVDDPEVLNLISGGESGGKRVKCLIYCCDYTRIIAEAKTLGRDYQPDRSYYKSFISLYDTIGAAQTAVIAAKAMGIDSLVTNFPHRSHPKELRRLLKLPEEHCMPLIAVALGYTDEKPTDKPRRISVDHVLHFGQYRPEVQTDRLNEEMDRIYPEYISEKYPHSLDWYFSEWMIEHYPDSVYQELAEDLRDAKILPLR